MAENWSSTDGIMRFPSGALVRGRGLRHPLPSGQTPTFGVYLLGKQPPRTEWEARWLPWPDFRLPKDRRLTRIVLEEALTRAGNERVEIACGGGRGRTGTALACMAVLDGVPADQAVAFVRRHYHPRAVETPWQRRFVLRFEEA
ncbi:protein-tyrosine phosphatase family protein [Streptomyces sp. NBC_00094]|uniref:protein-tyrosine phosphatase family protein n=1 Tax=Streptomyces sp. NBC_00094 TaxID=2903620 RepID=UPI0022516DE7|nr:protein-tyrosine phosphatase family protein [Streptomyces sp. NBC_00094]MCX5391378.1 protein phosphatase [Streptomyces sp. NBC_00094]